MLLLISEGIRRRVRSDRATVNESGHTSYQCREIVVELGENTYDYHSTRNWRQVEIYA